MQLQGRVMKDCEIYRVYMVIFCVVTSESVSVTEAQTCTSEHNVL